MRQAFHSCVPEHLASSQMFYSHHKPRLAPLYIRRPRGLERAPRRGETLDLSEKLFPLITIKRDECRSGVIQACTVTVCEQRHGPKPSEGTRVQELGEQWSRKRKT
jgi:hypothetical protein